MDKLNPLIDSTGKASAMRAASLLSVATGCAMLFGAAFGWATESMAQEALALTGAGLFGKFVQKLAENNKDRKMAEIDRKKDPE